MLKLVQSVGYSQRADHFFLIMQRIFAQPLPQRKPKLLITLNQLSQMDIPPYPLLPIPSQTVSPPRMHPPSLLDPYPTNHTLNHHKLPSHLLQTRSMPSEHKYMPLSFFLVVFTSPIPSNRPSAFRTQQSPISRSCFKAKMLAPESSTALSRWRKALKMAWRLIASIHHCQLPSKPRSMTTP